MSGVKKIGLDITKRNPIVPNMPNGKCIYVRADEKVYLKPVEWLPGTSNDDKKKSLTWIRQSADRKTIFRTIKGPNYNVSVSKAQSGPKGFYIEASFDGKQDFDNEVGIYVAGVTPPKIVNSDWRKSRVGVSVQSQGGGNPIAFGNEVLFYASTEGLNGYDNLVVEIYSPLLDETQPIKKYSNVKCEGGEIYLTIKDTSSWRPPVVRFQGNIQFYVKIKSEDGYVKNSGGTEKHALYLNIKNEFSYVDPQAPYNLTPTKVYEPDVSSVRYEPCKFKTIKITETVKQARSSKKEEHVVFDNGNSLEQVIKTVEQTERTIYFKANTVVIDGNGEAVLNNILKFLLENEYSEINLNGYASVNNVNNNEPLSKMRSDLVKKFFIDGGLDVTRIASVGNGEKETSFYSRTNYNTLSYESDNENARRVDIKFLFYGQDASTIIYETIAPIKGKDISIDIKDLKTLACFRSGDKHEDKIKIIDTGEALDNGSTSIEAAPPTIEHSIKSAMSKINVVPFKYIWPKKSPINQVYFYINSCRYFAKKDEATLLIKVYPDIEWSFALDLAVKVSNFKAANMPPGPVYEKYQKKAREAGFERWKLGESGKLPIEIGFNLSAKWNEGQRKGSFSKKFKQKIEPFANAIAKGAEIVQEVVDYAQGGATGTNLPVGFDIHYPKFTIVASWKLERLENLNTLNTVGELGFSASPLIGAEGIVDLLSIIVSGGTSANPAVSALISKFRGVAEKLGTSMIFTATFSGDLSGEVDNLKIDSLNGIQFKETQGKLSGDFKVVLKFQMSIELGSKRFRFIPLHAKLEAEAKADAGFGGDVKFNSDKEGVYVQPVLKFAGVKINLEITAEAGWWDHSFKFEKVVLDSREKEFGKRYLNKDDED